MRFLDLIITSTLWPAFVYDMHAKLRLFLLFYHLFTKLYVPKLKIMVFLMFSQRRKTIFESWNLDFFVCVSKSYPFNEVN